MSISRRGKHPGDEVVLRCGWDLADLVEAEDLILFDDGQCYLVGEVKINRAGSAYWARLVCMKLDDHAITDPNADGVVRMSWSK